MSHERELLAALKGLIEASGHMSPFGDGATVKTVKLAGKYMAALDRAEAAIAKAESKGAKHDAFMARVRS